jgi:hypothetical protein
MAQVYWCVRVYPNGEAKETVRDQAGLESWSDYNRRFRGNALFVNGELLDRGTLPQDVCEKISALLLAELPSRLPLVPMQQVMHGPEIFGGVVIDEPRVRYPDDRYRAGFDMASLVKAA